MRVAISGKAGTGKSVLAKLFIEEYNFKHISFARKLKDLAMDLFGLSYAQTYGSEKDRGLLQQLGPKMREIDSDVWVKYVLREIDRNPDADYVLDDLRYRNELDALKGAGFILIRIESSVEERKKRIPNTFPIDEFHESETDLDDYTDWDYVIDNESDLASLLNNGRFIRGLYK